MRVQERYRGCLLGLAAGDALGTTLEFKSPGAFAPLTGMVGGGPFGLEPGQWTDDTSMALCLAESLIERRSFDPRDQSERYLLWMESGHLSSNGRCFDVGMTVRGALRRFARTREPYCGSPDPGSAGNGSLMRLAPVPMAYARWPRMACARAAESSRTTHGAQECLDACSFFASLIIRALHGQEKGTLLAGVDPNAGRLSPKVAAVAGGSYRRKQPPELRSTGYVVDTLEAALWAFAATDSFAEGALRVVNLGGDADTAGAVYGQLAGAFYGVEGIPESWRGRLARRGEIEAFADGLLALARTGTMK
ncbi:MAG: ADP-ribosylglycohydrolase family protein [Elusimicrobia bacterium]|nr:ADP-ribosylglycohydrolase family protein [Elusimicrobiota bacterium]